MRTLTTTLWIAGWLVTSSVAVLPARAADTIIPPATGNSAAATGSSAAGTDDDDRPPIAHRLSEIIEPARLDHVNAKQAFEWWSHRASVPLVINWDKMEKDGIDPQVVINLDLHNVPAEQLLALIMQQVSDQPLIYETTPWYVTVSTKAEANRHLVMRVYDVGDLLHEAPPVGPPPSFDLGTALSNSNVGSSNGNNGSGTSSSGGSSGSLFTTSTQSQQPKVRSETERSEDLAHVIRETIEPDIWIENGGQASIRFFQGRLIVNAPLYVQAQIGIPEPSRGPPAVNPHYVVVMRPPAPSANSPAGISAQKPAPVSGVAGK